MSFNVPPDRVAESLQISHQAVRKWRHGEFATVNGYQDGVVLEKRVCTDETYLADTDLSHGYGQARRRGLSGQRLHMAVGTDVFKSPCTVACGHGRPSTRRIRGLRRSHSQRRDHRT